MKDTVEAVAEKKRFFIVYCTADFKVHIDATRYFIGDGYLDFYNEQDNLVASFITQNIFGVEEVR